MSTVTFLNKVFKLFCPPIVLNAFRYAKFGRLRGVQRVNTFEDGLAFCSENGYENADLVKIIVQKNLFFAEHLRGKRLLDLGAARSVIGVALSASQDKRTLRVLGFGGGIIIGSRNVS